jgi:hypothetical protein
VAVMHRALVFPQRQLTRAKISSIETYRLSSLWEKLPWESLVDLLLVVSSVHESDVVLDPIARKAGNLNLEAARITAILYIPCAILKNVGGVFDRPFICVLIFLADWFFILAIRRPE